LLLCFDVLDESLREWRWMCARVLGEEWGIFIMWFMKKKWCWYDKLDSYIYWKHEYMCFACNGTTVWVVGGPCGSSQVQENLGFSQKLMHHLAVHDFLPSDSLVRSCTSRCGWNGYELRVLLSFTLIYERGIVIIWEGCYGCKSNAWIKIRE